LKKENWATDLLTNLAKIYADDVDVLEIIEDTIDLYRNYVAYVHKMESLKPILKIKLSIDEYKNAVEEMAELFDRDRSVVQRYIRTIIKENEPEKESTCSKFAQV